MTLLTVPSDPFSTFLCPLLSLRRLTFLNQASMTPAFLLSSSQALAGRENEEVKEFREYNAPSLALHGLGSGCLPLSMSTAPVKEPSSCYSSCQVPVASLPSLALCTMGSRGFPLLPAPGCIPILRESLNPIHNCRVSSLNSPQSTLGEGSLFSAKTLADTDTELKNEKRETESLGNTGGPRGPHSQSPLSSNNKCQSSPPTLCFPAA